MMNRKAHLLAAFAAMSLLVAGCGGNSGSSNESAGSTQAQKAPPITLALAASMTASPGYVAAAKGYFKDAGVDVNIKLSNSSADALPLLATGDFTIAATTFSAAVFNALHQGNTIKILGDFVTVPKTGPRSEALLVDQDVFDAGNTTAAAFKGGKFAVPGPGGVSHYEILQALKKVGLTANDVEIVPLSREQLQSAFENNSIKGAWCGEPQCTLLAKAKVAQPIKDDSNVGNDPFSLLINADYMNKYPDAVTSFLSAWMKAARELDGDAWSTPEIQQIISKGTGIPTNLLSTIPKPSYYITDAAKFAPDQKFLTDFEDTMKQAKLVTYSGNLKVSEYYDPSLIKKALSKLGSD